MMKTVLLTYTATAVFFLCLDGLWLGLVAKSFYASRMGNLMADKVQILPAALFYLMYVAGMMIIAVKPLDLSVGWMQATAMGALLGFLCYGTYDMTNLSTVKGWSLSLSLVDWAWGTCVTAIVCGAGAWVKNIIH